MPVRPLIRNMMENLETDVASASAGLAKATPSSQDLSSETLHTGSIVPVKGVTAGVIRLRDENLCHGG